MPRVQGALFDRRISPLGSAPAFALLLSFCVFLVLREDLAVLPSVALILSLTVSAGWFLLGTEYPEKSSLPVACAIFLTAIFGLCFMNSRFADSGAVRQFADATGVVALEKKWGYMRVLLVEVRPSGPFEISEKYLLKLRGPSNLEPGDVVRFSGSVGQFKRSGASREFDEFLYWKAKGAAGEIIDPTLEVIGRSNGLPLWGSRLTRRISDSLPPRTAGYIKAAWTGERDPVLTEFHREAGTSHLLAVSGLHVGIVYVICRFLLKRFTFRLYITSAVIWFYAMISGGAPSSLRAALMFQLVILGGILGRKGKSFNSVCAAGSAMLLYNPWLFWDVGWRLSVLSVMALTSLYSLDADKMRKNVAAGPVVWLVTAIQAAWTFEAVPVAGLVINFFAVPVFGVLLPLASLLSLPALIGLKYGYAAASIAEFLFAGWERFSNNLTFLLPWKASFSAPMLFSGVIVMIYLFARACGFSAGRAIAAEAVNLTCLCFLLYNTNLF
jgi:competence protein ComEC